MKQLHAKPSQLCTSRFTGLRPRGALSAFRLAEGAFRLLAFVATLSAAASAGAMTDREEMELAASGKVNVKKASSDGFETAPKPSDIKFVADRKSAGEVASSESNCSYDDFSFSIPINRFFGSTSEIKKQIANGALPKWVQITMCVYDVDEPWEVDEIWYKGKKVGVLSGANGRWKKQTFSILTETLNFPTSEGVGEFGVPTPAQNEFTVKVSTKAGEEGKWYVSIAWVSLDIPAAPPVVVSHGIRNTKQNVEDLKQEIAALGLPVYTFSYGDKGNNSIVAGARQLNDAINMKTKNWGVERVTIVAHSMGGLKAREYATRYDGKAEKVDRILQIATPNAGSSWATADRRADIVLSIATLGIAHLAFWAGDFTGDAFDDLQPGYMKEYNISHPLVYGIQYKSIAGDCSRNWSKFDSLYRFLEFSRGDGMVSVESAHTMVPHPFNSPIEDIHATHSGLVDSKSKDGIVDYVISAYLYDDLLTQKTSKGRRRQLPNSKAASMSVKTMSTKEKTLSQTTNAPTTFGEAVAIYSGVQKTANRMTSVAFQIRKGEATSMHFYVDENDISSLSLVAPSGVEFSETCEEVLFSRNSFSTIILLGHPEVGIWKLKFQSTGTNLREYLLQVDESNSGIELNPELAAEAVRVGNSFFVTMQPKVDGKTPTGVSCSVVVQKPDKTTATYILRRTGDVYSASIPASVEGRYSMVAQATISGTTYSCNLFGTAYASSAMIGADAGSGPVDEDGNGMYDWLVARVGINGADSSKAYRVLAELVDANGGHIEWASGTAEAGMSYAELYFNGAHIFDYGRTAKYVITDVRLFEMGDDWEAQTDARSNWLELDGSSWARYEHELVTIVGTGEDSVVRPGGATMGDLSVGLDVAFDASVSGSYSFSASLKAPDGTLVASAYGSATLTTSLSEGVDIQCVAMTFPGEDIVAAGLEGPWIVTDVLFWNSYHELSPEGEYETSVHTLSSLQSGYDLAFALAGKLSGNWPEAVYLSDSPSEKGSETPVRRSFLVGETIFPHIAFANVGTQAIPATPFNIRFLVQDEHGNVIATRDNNEDHAIGVNACRYWFQYAWPGIQRLPVGRYTYTVELDTGNAVPESDETNNVVSIPFKVVTAIPPDNDDVADAIPLVGSVAAARGSNINATREDGEPVPIAQNRVSGSAWWTWTAPEDGEYCFSTDGSDFDTVLAVFTGDGLGALQEVNSNDDFSEDVLRTSSLWIPNVTAGTTYFVSVAGYGAQSGTIRLYIQPDIGCRSAREAEIQEGADCYHLAFTTDPDAPWEGIGLSGAVGKDAVRSAEIGNNDLSLLATTLSGPGILAFRWKVSSEPRFDTLEFYLDTTCVPGTLSGVGGNWRYEAFKVTGSGDHSALWMYGKDRSDSAGDDRGWIDQVVWVENSPLTPVYRFYSKSYKGHFFTTDRPERDNLIQSNPNWNYEGAAFFTHGSQADGTVPAYRFYSKAYRGHFYTIDEAEMASIRATNPNWRYEGVAYYVRSSPGAGTTPVYRFWSKAYRHHFFTTDAAEKDNLIATNPNWKYEGIAYYAWATPEDAAGAGVGASSLKYAVRPLSDADSADELSFSQASGQSGMPSKGTTVSCNSGEEASSAGTTSSVVDSVADTDSADGVLPPWILTLLPDEIDIPPDEMVSVDGLLIETRTDAPDNAFAGDVSVAGDDAVVDFRFSLPEMGSAIVFGRDGDILLEEQESGEFFDFALPASGEWYWLHVFGGEKEEPFTLWIRAD